ncbi:hypothetical protein BKA70DRAFT_1265784 [Coprinopsis sp. MPI-PUGE-AT-0042]|nr:hypothetical protein BKA70DRAFT_1330944 [Coprinopsis sp. MPI-PUGE-AT-0042]KAH6913022.1 hypothetical protein BKA70DRAFT_1265784 [Coprinopsis sp. MPI-PUGE-AT-0042]
MADSRGPDAFFALLIFALFASIILLLTAVWSPIVKRQPAWLSLMFSNILATASYSLLFFFGYKSEQEPPFGLCVSQAALGYATPVPATGTTLTLVVTTFFTVKARISGAAVTRRTNATVLIIGFPYVMHGIMFLAALIVGLVNPMTVQRGDEFYCTFIIRTPARTTAGISILLMSIAIAFLGGIFWHLRGHWKMMGRMTIRITVFFLACLAAIITASTLPGSANQDLSIVLACLAVAVVLIFGLAKDIGQAWMFWRKPREMAPAADAEEKALGRVETSETV